MDEPGIGGGDHLPLALLSLPELRAYRHSMNDEEVRVSYWRRLIQARADVTRAGGGIGIADATALRRVLADDHARTARTSRLRELPNDDSPPLPNIAALWSRLDGEDDEGGRILLLEDLMTVEVELSAYRHDLHQRIDAATNELIGRYRAEPKLCLAVLPLADRSADRAVARGRTNGRRDG